MKNQHEKLNEDFRLAAKRGRFVVADDGTCRSLQTGRYLGSINDVCRTALHKKKSGRGPSQPAADDTDDITQ